MHIAHGNTRSPPIPPILNTHATHKKRSAVDQVPLVVSQQLAAQSPARVRRLEALVELKKLYRNCLRADTLLELPTPIYTARE